MSFWQRNKTLLAVLGFQVALTLSFGGGALRAANEPGFKLVDSAGTNVAAVDASGNIKVSAAGGTTGPAANVSLVSTQVTVSNTATLVPATALAARANIMIYNNGATVMYCGSGTVTASTGIPVVGSSSLSLDYGPTTAVKCITASGSTEARALEAS